MPKRYKKIVCICIISALMLVFAGKFNTTRIVHAEAVGVVKVSGYLNVRKGPGTSYALLKSGGTNVTLSNGQKVSIIAKAGDWYQASFKLNGKNLKGYVLGSYIKVQGGTACTSVKASVAVKSLKLKTKTSDKSANVKSGLKDISINKDSNVLVLDDVTSGNQKWYYISCQYSGKTYKGYVKPGNLKISYGNGIPGIWEGSVKFPLYKEAGKNAIVENAGRKVNIGVNKQFTILNEKTVAGTRYFYIKASAGKAVVRGYLPADAVRFQIVQAKGSTAKETEAPDNTKEPADTKKPDSTKEPAATKEPDNTKEPDSTKEPAGTSAPADTKEPAATGTPSDTSTPAETAVPTQKPEPLDDAEFKKKLKEEGFPDDYITPLMELHAKYPYWEFKAFKTGLKWGTVIKNESAVGVNLLSNNKSYAWKSTADGAYDWTKDKYIPFDGSTWVTASVKAVKYYMDPRNFLDERGIFQFENLEYQSSTQTQDGVEKILNNTPMYNAKFSYPNSLGNSVDIKYSKAFIKAAESSKVSPYHLASRVKQEVVLSNTLMSSSVSGNVAGYEGIYNFYNIGAYNSTEAGGAIANGLKWASSGTTYNRPWKDRYKSITGGAEYIGKNYINVGQNTLYLQKFNVTSKNRYEHQYMSNVEAPNSEATKTVSAYGVIEKDMPITFSIPVYEEMPEEPCEVPSGGKNPNNYLKTLYVKNHPFTSNFVLGDDGSKKYKLVVDKSVESIKICATKVSSHAVLTGTGTKTLADGTTTFTVKVTSESGEARKYTIEVTRQ